MLASINKLTHHPKKLPQKSNDKSNAKKRIVNKAVKEVVHEAGLKGEDNIDVLALFEEAVRKLVDAQDGGGLVELKGKFSEKETRM